MRLGVLADIHGNLPALEAVIAELERLQPDHVLLNGDLINAVPFSAAVIDRVRELGWVVVRGNHEFYYLDYVSPQAGVEYQDPARWGQLHWLAAQLTPEQGAYLAMLPDERTLYLPDTAPVRVAHGVPGQNRVGFHSQQPAAEIVAAVAHVAEETLISAHTHVQVDRHVYLHADMVQDFLADPHPNRFTCPNGPRHWHVINPGSVGLPLNGDPAAQFAILESVPEAVEPGGWRVTHHRVPYDRRPALAAYEESGMMEAGGVITRLFYWELVTAEPEIILFYRWARERGMEPDEDIDSTFAAYVAATGRDGYVRARDPLWGMRG